jgi:hypothetical protein
MADTVTPKKTAQNRAQGQQSASLRRSITAEISDPHSDTVLEALTRTCDQCRAPIGVTCLKRGGIHQDLLGRVIHIGRMSPR